MDEQKPVSERNKAIPLSELKCWNCGGKFGKRTKVSDLYYFEGSSDEDLFNDFFLEKLTLGYNDNYKGDVFLTCANCVKKVKRKYKNWIKDYINADSRFLDSDLQEKYGTEQGDNLTSQKKQQVLKMLGKGYGSVAIAEKLGLKKMQVAAIKAWKTMGKY